MINGVQRHRKIDRSLLDQTAYCESLLGHALKSGAISAGDLERFQGECLLLLSEKCKRSTGGRSSSVRGEVADDIMKSIFFTLGVALKEYDEPDDAVSALHTRGTKDMYLAGLQKIKVKIYITRILHCSVLRDMVHTDNHFYNSTLSGGISGFFKHYDPKYGAHNTHITVDYESCIFPSEYRGIEFIQKYLYSLQCENLFCRRFDSKAINRLLSRTAIKYGELTRDISCNIYEVVLCAAISSFIADKNVYELKTFAVSPLDNAALLNATADLCELLGTEASVLRYSEEVARTKYVEICKMMDFLSEDD